MASVKSANYSARRYKCHECPLRPMKVFRDFSPEELDFVNSFKRGELSVDRGADILLEGTQAAHLFSVLSGWAFRYKLLPDGRRQILNYVLPGDLLGLQGSLMGDMQHSVEALSPMLLCVFQRDSLPRLYEKHPGLAYDITWLAAREEQMLDENLLSIGRRSALERAAYLLAFIAIRARAVGLGKDTIPITQQHVADTLGLSLVHTNKTLKKLAAREAIAWREGGCAILDLDRLIEISGWEPPGERTRPLV